MLNLLILMNHTMFLGGQAHLSQIKHTTHFYKCLVTFIFPVFRQLILLTMEKSRHPNKKKGVSKTKELALTDRMCL